MRRVPPATPPLDADARADRNRQVAELLSRTALGDRAAFARLYEQTAPHLLGMILRITRHRERAEDILQEVYVNVWKAAASYDGRLAQPLTWLSSVARNRAIDSLRREQTQPMTLSASLPGDSDDDDRDLLQEFASQDAGPLEQLEAAAEARALRGCLGQLSGEQQQAMALAFYQGQSYSEVAEHLHQPLGTVKSWVRRGLQALKGCLERSTATPG